MKRRVLVTGATGQLGQPLVSRLRDAGHEVFAHDSQSLDFRQPARVLETIEEQRPDLILHCAAKTAVDVCETERDDAYLINALGTRAVATAARRVKARLIAVSTDYVFAGDCPDGYDEFSSPAPKSVYGRSKWLGEQAVLQASMENVVVRVSWLFGPQGRNFLDAIFARALAGEGLRIVDDQVGIPTYAPDLAGTLLELSESPVNGLVHVSSGDQSVSWYGFARAALELAGLEVEVEAVTSEEFPRPAPRPRCSVLRSLVLGAYGLHKPRCWREALPEFLAARGWMG